MVFWTDKSDGKTHDRVMILSCQQAGDDMVEDKQEREEDVPNEEDPYSEENTEQVKSSEEHFCLFYCLVH